MSKILGVSVKKGKNANSSGVIPQYAFLYIEEYQKEGDIFKGSCCRPYLVHPDCVQLICEINKVQNIYQLIGREVENTFHDIKNTKFGNSEAIAVLRCK